MSNDLGSGGYVISSRYRLEAQLGRGGMGSVWRATDLTLGSPVAIKLIDPDIAADEGVRARFYQEAQAAAALRSPHVVQILDYGVDRGVPFIAMELLEGESLADRLARVRVLPWAETARIFGDVGRAVRRAHEAGIVHRDLKPENIFLVRNDDQEIAKVLDFGIAKRVTSDGEAQPVTTGAAAYQPARAGTQTGALIGTLPYMSPEQARGAKVDWQTDLWALAAIAFECVCGIALFSPDLPPGELVLAICSNPLPVPSQVAAPRALPPGFDAWFARAAQRDPAARFHSAKDLVESLRTILSVAPAPQAGTQMGLGPGSVPPPAGHDGGRPPVPPGPAGAVSTDVPTSPRIAESARPPTLDGGASVDGRIAPRDTSSRLGAALSAAAILVAGGALAYWVATSRASTSSPSAPVAVGSQVAPSSGVSVSISSPVQEGAPVSVTPAPAAPEPSAAPPASTNTKAPASDGPKPKVPADRPSSPTKRPDAPVAPAPGPAITKKKDDRIGF